jgi:hypothetical protein
MADKRFILLVSVGLMVLAPRPVAWEAFGTTDIRFPVEDGLEPLMVARGDRGKAADALLWSGRREPLSAERVEWFGACTSFALGAREAVKFLGPVGVPPIPRLPPSRDERVGSGSPLSDAGARLGLRRWVTRLPTSASIAAGAADFLGGFTTVMFDTGG